MGTPTTPDLVDLWAEALVPEAFAFPHSAFRVDLRDEPADLDEWTRRELGEALSFRYPGSGSLMGGVVAVQDAGVRWQWHHEPDHPMAGTTREVRDQIGALRSPWLLVAAIPGPRIEWVEREVDGAFEEELEVVDPDWSLRFHAEVRRPGLAAVTSGVLDFHLDELVAVHRDDPRRDGFTRAAESVLTGHPARRRHRLRGH